MKLKRKIKKNILQNEFNGKTPFPFRLINALKDIMNNYLELGTYNLNDISYENRPKEMEKMTKDDFELLQEISPYYYIDEDGQLHFTSKYL